MPFSCVICFGNLDQPPECMMAVEGRQERMIGKDVAANKISAGRCGHIFHDVCIRKWFENQRNTGRTKQCPSCRTVIRQLKTIFPAEAVITDAGNGSEDQSRRSVTRISAGSGSSFQRRKSCSLIPGTQRKLKCSMCAILFWFSGVFTVLLARAFFDLLPQVREVLANDEVVGLSAQ